MCWGLLLQPVVFTGTMTNGYWEILVVYMKCPFSDIFVEVLETLGDSPFHPLSSLLNPMEPSNHGLDLLNCELK